MKGLNNECDCDIGCSIRVLEVIVTLNHDWGWISCIGLWFSTISRIATRPQSKTLPLYFSGFLCFLFLFFES